MQHRKIRLGKQWIGEHHRSGWDYALGWLRDLSDDRGVLFDGIVDKKFGFGADAGDRNNSFRAYGEPWIGVLHNPPCVPPWFGTSAAQITQSAQWRQSLSNCKGLFTLSEYLAAWLRQRVAVPVCVLLHPTETPAEQFDIDSYHINSNKRLLHLGWWLRRFRSFHLLRAPSFEKCLLHIDAPWVNRAITAELKEAPMPIQPWTVLQYVDNRAYDQLLTNNIVFLDLYDTSANNALIECIVRNTPIVVCRHPAVVEYLGEEYPLLFDDLCGASELLSDQRNIDAAHDYLRGRRDLHEQISGSAFRRSFEESAIYKSL